VDRASPEGATPVTATGVPTSAPSSRARCDRDLSPGTTTSPASGPGWTVTTSGTVMSTSLREIGAELAGIVEVDVAEIFLRRVV
jgi:hypothetical protein